MKDQVFALGLRAWNQFRGFSLGQRAVTIAAVLALAIGGYFFLTWKTTPTYAPLYTNLAAADASAIVDKLNSQGITYQLAANGTEVLVPKGQVYSTRLTMSSAGLPDSSQSGYSLLDKEGVTTSEFKQQVDYQRAIEGELAKTIQAINGVQAATVHLAIPQANVFNDGTQNPTAAVMVATSAVTTLTPEQVQSVTYMVSSSVPGMKASDVTVTDSNGTVLAAPGSDTSGTAGASSQAQLTQQYNSQVSSSLQSMIDQAIGSGHAHVTVNSVLNFNKVSTTKQSYVWSKNAPPISQTSSKETYTGTGAGTGILGSTGTTTAGTSGAGNYTKSSATQDNALGTVTETTQNAPGQLQNLNVAVVLDKSVKGLNITAISNLVKSGVGFNAKRGDALSVQAIPFSNTAAVAAAAAVALAAKVAAAKVAHDSLIGMIKQGGLAAIVIAIVIGTWLGGKRRRKAARAPEVNDDLFGLDDASANQAPVSVAELISPVSDLREAASRRRSLASVAGDRPEDVARVLSGWLNTKEG